MTVQPVANDQPVTVLGLPGLTDFLCVVVCAVADEGRDSGQRIRSSDITMAALDPIAAGQMALQLYTQFLWEEGESIICGGCVGVFAGGTVNLLHETTGDVEDSDDTPEE